MECKFCNDLKVEEVNLKNDAVIRTLEVEATFHRYNPYGCSIMIFESDEGYPLKYCPECGRSLKEMTDNKVISIEDDNSALHQLGAYFGIVVSKNPDDKTAIEMYIRVHEIRSFFEKYLYSGSWIPSEQQKENDE